MVELRLESVEDSSMPKDCFISVRVGETQKLSRLAGQRTYRFPQAGDKRFGKIEVFKRIGSCSVDIDPDNSDARNISISCLDAGFGSLGLKVDVQPTGNNVQKAKAEDEPADAAKKPGSKVKAAKDYLNKHGLEVRLSEAMQAVLRERPEDPALFLAQKLTGGAKLPPLESAPVLPSNQANSFPEPVARNKLEPLKQATRTAAPKVAIVPFSAYYKENLKTMGMSAAMAIYRRFPDFVAAAKKATPGPRPAAVVPFKGYHLQNFKTAGAACFDKIHARFPARNEAMKRAAPAILPKAPSHLMPSVGTWIMAVPKVMSTGKSPAPAAPAAPAKSFRLRPSVGTWIMPLPTMEPEVKPFKLRPSVGTWLAPRPVVEETQPAAAAKSAARAAAPAASKPAFALTPSAGTWLAKPQSVWRPQTAVTRSLKGLRPPAAMSVDERCEAERVLTQALLEMNGKFQGDYYPLTGSSSCFMCPGGMSEDDARTLSSKRILFEVPGGGVSGRGVFCSASMTVAVQINTQDAHARFVVFKQGAEAEQEMRLLEGAVKQHLQQQGYALV